MADIKGILPEDKISEQITRGKLGPQPLLVIDKSRSMISDNEIMVTVVITNKGNATCKQMSLSICSKGKYEVKKASATGVVSVVKVDGRCADIAAKEMAPQQWGSVDLLFDNPTDVEYCDVKADEGNEYGYKPVFALGFDMMYENEKQSPV